jgi:hypothetical protein
MDYNIKYFNGLKLIAIGTIGMTFSIALPIYLKINFNLDHKIMVLLISSGSLISWILGYLMSKKNEFFTVNEKGLFNRKFGWIKWEDVESVNLKDYYENEILTIRFKLKHKISIPSNINSSQNRSQFLAFKKDLINWVSRVPNSKSGIIHKTYAYAGKGFKLLGYISILAIILVTIYTINSWMEGEMSARKIPALIMVYSSAFTLIARIFRGSFSGGKENRNNN